MWLEMCLVSMLTLWEKKDFNGFWMVVVRNGYGHLDPKICFS